MPKIKKTAPAPLIAAHPLEMRYKRAKHPSYVLNATVRTYGSPLGSFGLNWLGGGALTSMLRAVFSSMEPQFVEARAVLKAAGFKQRPRQIHFDTLALIERAYPSLITREELAEELGAEPREIDQTLTYLRGFVVNMCGLSVLSDWRGSVGIATVDLWVVWQSRMARMINGLASTQAEQGMGEETLQRYSLDVTERLPTVQPVLLAPQMQEGASVN